MRRYYELYYYGMFVGRIKSHSSDFSLFLKRGRSEGVILLTCVILLLQVLLEQSEGAEDPPGRGLQAGQCHSAGSASEGSPSGGNTERQTSQTS